MSVRPSSLAIAPGLARPAAHIGGWLWLAYLLPVLIVAVPLVKGQLGSRKKRKHPRPTTAARRRR
ncbi:MAG: hypothetical protein AB7V58_00800 [Solirubrobacterales bacterium]